MAVATGEGRGSTPPRQRRAVRIARELHDVLGYRISLINVQAKPRCTAWTPIQGRPNRHWCPSSRPAKTG
ncbi:histidine kinase [Saccharopolyspora spinosa]|uniref:histidine kinase n=1 Tax=Saccharopolyspora spinosa TaxID=60894 RepID=UPI00192BA715